jgi:DIS3-like exonuclease 2
MSTESDTRGGGRRTNPKKQQQQQQHPAKKHTAPGNSKRSDSQRTNDKPKDEAYTPHWSLEDCLKAYQAGTLVRGTLRVLPFSPSAAATSRSFLTCDRGNFSQDISIASAYDRNRAMDGDVVFVELSTRTSEEDKEEEKKEKKPLPEQLQEMTLSEDAEAGDVIHDFWNKEKTTTRSADDTLWQDDPIQVDLWNPVVPIQRPKPRTTVLLFTTDDRRRQKELKEQQQPQGVVVRILPPKTVYSEVDPSRANVVPTRRVVGTVKVLNPNTVLLTPNNQSLPQFRCHAGPTLKLMEQRQRQDEEISNTDKGPEEANTNNNNNSNNNSDPCYYFQAEYEYASWKETHKWPPCTRVKILGTACVLEDEIKALLAEFDVDHGEFTSDILKNVDDAVQSGVYYDKDGTQGWKPTSRMYEGRRDYRSERIFTIDPTTAKDLDDALHIKKLPDGTIELGVHIADVSYFVCPETAVDKEAARRSTTVYLVDRTVPMLPRPLCEVACSLNENVERLAFSCVWRMRPNGTLVKDDVWYGRSVIKSCARLDYSTAQNIIENKVATGETTLEETLWPASRQPVGHTVEQVAADVRLMHAVAMARRRLRFENGALALHGIKLTFQLDTDGQTPLLTAPYPIRDSNRLVEEFMLLANFLVAQRLITHASRRALLRNHGEPQMEKVGDLVAVVKAACGFEMDCSSSQALHASLVRLGCECQDPLVLQCATQLTMGPMVPADYFCAGQVESEEWRHFALNIPYYTHFTSPIRRYPDVLVHRLLQATLDGTVEDFEMDSEAIHSTCDHCNDKRMKSKKAQERCDRVFLSLFVKANPIQSQLGVVLSVGKSAFTVFVPSLGVNALLYLQDHKDLLTYASDEDRDGTKRILLQQKPDTSSIHWGVLEIVLLTKLQVTITCRDQPPVDVKLRLEGPWRD